MGKIKKLKNRVFTGFPENTGKLHIGPPISPVWGWLFGLEEVPTLGHVTLRQAHTVGPQTGMGSGSLGTLEPSLRRYK